MLLPVEAQLSLPGKPLEVRGDQVLELVQILRVITQGSDMQAGSVRMQVREAEGEFDAPVLLIETDRQLVGELRTQTADITRRRRGGDIAGGNARSADTVAALSVCMALGGEGIQYVARVEARPLGHAADARLGTFHGYLPRSLQAQAKRLRGVKVRSSALRHERLANL